MPFDESKFKKATPSSPSRPSSATNKTPTVNIGGYDIDPRAIAAGVVRGVGGFAPGGWIGAGANAVTEGIAQTIEDKPYNLANIGGAAAIGAVPFPIVGSALKMMAKGAALSGAGTALRQQTESGLHMPDEEEGKQIALSSLLGAGGGGLAHVVGKNFDTSKFKKAPIKAIEEVKIPTKPAVKATVEELQAHTPKFAIGGKSFEPQWKNDTDKALFVISQSKKHKFHNDYMEFLTKTTGLNEEEIQTAGKELREKLKIYLTGQKVQGDISVPKLNTFKIKVGKPKITFQGAQEMPVVNTPTNEVPKIDLQTPTEVPDIQLNDFTMRPIKDQLKDWGKHPIRKLAAEARQLQTTGDLSFPFRQGITNVTRKEFWDSMVPMMKAALKEENFGEIQKGIAVRPKFEMMEKAGLQFPGIGKSAELAEENISKDTIIEHLGVGRIKPIRASNRAYTAFANKLRADLFDSMSDLAEKSGISLIDADGNVNKNAQAIARYINDSTGRGHLGKLEANAAILNDVLFSPKLMASRVNMFRRAFQDPRMIEQGVDSALSKQLRKRAIRDMAAVGGLAGLSMGTSELLGSKGTLNPMSTDFGKLKIGKTRIDMTGGFQQYLRVATQLATGKASNEGEISDKNRLNTAIRFGRNKLAPLAGAIVDFMAEKNVLGEKFQFDEAAKDRIIPLIIQDIQEVAKEDPKLLPLTVPASIFGAGVQSYGQKPISNRKKSGGSSYKMPPVKVH